MTLFDDLAQLTRDQVEVLHGEDVLLHVPAEQKVPEDRLRFEEAPTRATGVFHFDSEVDRESLKPSPMREVSRAPALHRGDVSTVSITMDRSCWKRGTVLERVEHGEWYSMEEPVVNDLGQVSFLIQKTTKPTHA